MNKDALYRIQSLIAFRYRHQSKSEDCFVGEGYAVFVSGRAESKLSGVEGVGVRAIRK